MFNFQRRIEKEVAKQIDRKQAVDKYEQNKRAAIKWLIDKKADIRFFENVTFAYLKCGCSVRWGYYFYSYQVPEFKPSFRRCAEHKVPFEDFPV